jgi:hypothetical protein
MKRRVTNTLLALLVCALALGPAQAQDVKAKPKPKPVIVVSVPAQETKAPKAPKPAKPAKPLPPASAPDPEDREEKLTRHKIAATATVVVRLELGSGDITVRGWEKNEVQAEADSRGKVVLERADDGDPEKPAAQIEVQIKKSTARELAHGDGDCENHDGDSCAGCQNQVEYITLDVPRGATVFLKSANGDVSATNVAEANLEAINGDVRARQIARHINAYAANGDVGLKEVTGRITARSLSGDVGIYGAQPLQAGDYLRATAISGEVLLYQATHSNLEASSVSGEILFQGALTKGGNYSFKTTSGDIALIIPDDSSFKLNAKVAYGDINTEFACRHESGQSADELKKGKLTGVCGKGEANLSLTSFSGTIALQKKK